MKGLLVNYNGRDCFVVGDGEIMSFPDTESITKMFAFISCKFRGPVKSILAAQMMDKMNPRAFDLDQNLDIYIESREPVDLFNGSLGWRVNGMISELEVERIQLEGTSDNPIRDLLKAIGIPEDQIFAETDKDIYDLLLTKDGKHYAVCDGIGSVPVAYSVEELITFVVPAKSALEGYQLRAIKLPPSVEEFDYYVTKEKKNPRPVKLYRSLYMIEMGENVEEIVVEDITEKILKP